MQCSVAGLIIHCYASGAVFNLLQLFVQSSVLNLQFQYLLLTGWGQLVTAAWRVYTCIVCIGGTIPPQKTRKESKSHCVRPCICVIASDIISVSLWVLICSPVRHYQWHYKCPNVFPCVCHYKWRYKCHYVSPYVSCWEIDDIPWTWEHT